MNVYLVREQGVCFALSTHQIKQRQIQPVGEVFGCVVDVH
jgi:hypothetical protein